MENLIGGGREGIKREWKRVWYPNFIRHNDKKDGALPSSLRN